MVITKETEDGSITIVDKVREMIRLGAGLDESGLLSTKTQDKALACLKRFQQRLKSIPSHRIRAVGTNTFRVAKNSREFLLLAEQALGHPISIVSGHEEARLVYLGAAFDLSVSDKKRLVIDIGGGSTELTIGKAFQPLIMDSLYMGCVSLTRKIFDDGGITKSRILQAQHVVRRELETVIERYRLAGWDEVVGTSGTIKSIDSVARTLGIERDWISKEGLECIAEWTLEQGRSDALDAVSEQRRPVFIGGFIILSTIFRDLSIERMDISQGALREGVAYELIGRLQNRDSRFSGVNTLVTQFQTDEKQSERVRVLSQKFFHQIRDQWELNQDIEWKLLYWAAQLHEVGMAVSYSHHHQHSAYIVENSDIDGFSRQIQRVLSMILRNSRQKISTGHNAWHDKELLQRVIKLTILLRLAIAIYRGRTDVDIKNLRVSATGTTIFLVVDQIWWNEHPLTIFDLKAEESYLIATGFQLVVTRDEG